MFDWALNMPLCTNHINDYFHQSYLPDKSDTENKLYQITSCID